MSEFNNTWVLVDKNGESSLMIEFPDLNNIKDGKRIMITGESEEEIYAEYEVKYIIPFNNKYEVN